MMFTSRAFLNLVLDQTSISANALPSSLSNQDSFNVIQIALATRFEKDEGREKETVAEF